MALTERRQSTVGLEPQVVEHEDSLAIERRLIRPAHDQGAVQAALDLLGLVRVRVVPERSGVGDGESVLEGLARLDLPLHRSRSVHLGGNANTVPVDRRRLGEVVRQSHFDRVADLGLDQRPRHLAVEPESGDASTGSELPLGLARVELDGHRLPIRPCLDLHLACLSLEGLDAFGNELGVVLYPAEQRRSPRVLPLQTEKVKPGQSRNPSVVLEPPVLV